ncbi:MAG: sulfatase-like hydrolase/transferase [Ruminococcus sp.]|nr:sulfatase-like hydrolase/transferase [Ruminococcus sp.]MDO4420092.1 sulfatase-like hydrolase/transferase [Ruminococcus sp.]
MKFFSKLKTFLFADDRKLKSRAVISFGAVLTFVMTYFLAPIIEIFVANTMFFDYTISQVMLPVGVSALVVFAVLFGLSFIMKGRLLNWYLSLLVGLSLGAYVQSIFMNSSVGVLDGTEVLWKDLAVEAVIGLAIWGFILFLLFALQQFSKKIWTYATGFLCVLLCVMQLASSVGVFFISDIDEKSNIQATRVGEFDLSDKHNVIVLAIDSFDVTFAEEVMENNPEYFDEFDGFTWYKNTTPHYSRTFPSVAYLFTGENSFYTSEYDDAMSTAWSNNGFFEDMKDAGYAIRIYAHQKYVNPDGEYLMEYLDNYKVIEPEIDYLKLEKEMLMLSLYRTAPVALKPFFETDTTQANSAYSLTNNERISLTDYAFYDRLTSEKLNKDNNSGEKGTFSYYLFRGCHAPYLFDENCEKTDEKVTVKEATRGALTNVSEYLKQLKELGIYDSSTIIVTSDHGKSGTITELDAPRVVSMFYKPAGSTGEMKESNSPQQLVNVRPTVLKEMGLDYADYGTPFDEVAEDADVTRYMYMSGASEDGSVREENLVTYEIKGDANNFENWKIIDKFPIEYPFLQG